VSVDDLRFDFGEIPVGVYVLACVSDRKIIAVRSIRIAAGAEPFTINYKPDVDGEAANR
jgi:hypothetical protein